MTEQPKCEECGNPQRKSRKGYPIQYCGKPCPPPPEQPIDAQKLTKEIIEAEVELRAMGNAPKSECKCLDCNLPDIGIESLGWVPAFTCLKCDKQFPAFMQVEFDSHVAACSYEKPLKSSRATEGKNTCIIEPETKGKSSEVAGQHFEQPNQIAGIDKTDSICSNCGKEKSIYMLKCFNCGTKPEQHEPVGCPDLDAMHLGIPNKPEKSLCHQTMTSRECIGCSIDAAGKCPLNVKPEQPNTELLIVKTIQGLLSAVNRELEKLVELQKAIE